jgi:hypothetical protein
LWADWKYLGSLCLPDPLREQYIDPYKGLPIMISASGDGTPVPFKGYTGVITGFNPHIQAADVRLDIGQKTVLIKVECLRF